MEKLTGGNQDKNYSLNLFKYKTSIDRENIKSNRF